MELKFISQDEICKDINKHMWLAIKPTSHGKPYTDGLMQERWNSIANALELHFSRTNPLK